MPEKTAPPSITDPNTPQVVFQVSPGAKIKKILFIILPIVTLIIIIFLLNLTGRLRFPEVDKTIAIVGNEKITLSQIKKIASEKYTKKAGTKEFQQVVLDTLIERAVLDQEAKRLQISVSENEIAKYIGDKAFKQPVASSSSSSSLFTDFKYNLLKEKILSKSVESRKAFTISFWTPPNKWTLPPNISESTVKEQRKQGELMLKEAQERLKKGGRVLSVALELSKKYPTVESLIAVNGYILEKTADQTVLNKPVLYIFDQKKAGQLFYDTLFALKQNEVRLLIKDDGSGGWVFQVVNINQGNHLSYADWLKNKKQELVKTYLSL